MCFDMWSSFLDTGFGSSFSLRWSQICKLSSPFGLLIGLLINWSSWDSFLRPELLFYLSSMLVNPPNFRSISLSFSLAMPHCGHPRQVILPCFDIAVDLKFTYCSHVDVSEHMLESDILRAQKTTNTTAPLKEMKVWLIFDEPKCIVDQRTKTYLALGMKTSSVCLRSLIQPSSREIKKLSDVWPLGVFEPLNFWTVKSLSTKLHMIAFKTPWQYKKIWFKIRQPNCCKVSQRDC